jgi:hypothetical protein
MYSPFFKTLHDEKSPVGEFGGGVHYSILRLISWHDKHLRPLQRANFQDLAVVWDGDHDTRLISVLQSLYLSGLTPPVLFIGERKGMLWLILDPEAAKRLDLEEYEKRTGDAVGQSGIGDFWSIELESEAGHSGLFGLSDFESKTYLECINLLWHLGLKDAVVEHLDGAFG